MKISFISAFYNNFLVTKLMVDSLIRAVPYTIEYELIFVNDASSDETCNYLRDLEQKNVKIIENKKNLGYAKSNNIGAKQATGDLLLFLNNDLVFLDNWLSPIIKLLSCNPKWIVGNVQLRSIDKSIDHEGICIWINQEERKFEFRHITKSNDSNNSTYEVIPAVTGACFGIHRALFEQLGGFDESFINGCEDLDLCYRARSIGATIHVAENSVVLHHVSATRKKNKFRDISNSLQLFEKHPQQITLDIARQICVDDLYKKTISDETLGFCYEYIHGRKIGPPIHAKVLAREIYNNTVKLIELEVAEHHRKVKKEAELREQIALNEHTSLDEFKKGVLRVKSTPRMLTIETTSRCNLRCVMCPHGINAVDRPKHMNESLALKLDSFIHQAKHIQLHGIGEPLNSPTFWEMLDRIPEACDASINTNLTTPDQKKLNRLAESNIKIINVSIDAAKPETYQKIRGAQLDTCLSNLKKIVGLVKERDIKKHIYINMTLMRSNIDEVKDFIALAKNYQVDAVWLWHLNKWSEEEMRRYVVERDGWRFDYAQEGLWNHPTLSNDRIADAYEYAKSIQMPLYTADNKSLMFE